MLPYGSLVLTFRRKCSLVRCSVPGIFISSAKLPLHASLSTLRRCSRCATRLVRFHRALRRLFPTVIILRLESLFSSYCASRCSRSATLPLLAGFGILQILDLLDFRRILDLSSDSS